ncbi:DUF1499 domain-containing protein [uncultured Tateyamaria sp.]|uniref:DUF1499 domain-containing protein n=1 Tax=Tateyamaria sp. 1078 TaxID=3417464 RepID=UPI00260F3B2F|nr:DUF1499 domain-containing protein [uncultured Tateyamaria sp.]
MYIIVIIIILFVAALAYVRLAPSAPDRWHKPVDATTSSDRMGGAIRVLSTDEGALARVDAAARALPRTTVLAGSVEEGRITYVTRSKVIGFPDYTTVEYNDGLLRMYARLRFGRSDFGVNADRLQRLLTAAER